MGVLVREAGLTATGEDAAVQGDTPGEVTAALVHARGAKSHALIEFGHFTDTYAATCHPDADAALRLTAALNRLSPCGCFRQTLAVLSPKLSLAS